MKKLITLFTTLAVFLCFNAQAALITLTPSSNLITLGDSFTVDVTVSDLAPGEELALFDIDTTFDPAVVDLTSVAFGSALGGPLDSLQLDFLPNVFENSFLSELALQGLQGAPFTIFTLSFDTLATSAASVISASVNNLGFLDFIGNEIDVSVESTTVAIIEPPVSIPETGTLFLLLTGLCALLRRRV